ncbi:MAG: dimethyl sulfoxide reductase anchor subunit [Rhodoferax sp.]|nr:dimethyl sulfoxide reductase anchor subunit [Rhodoferax sp.]
MKPAFSVIFLTTLMGAGQGLFLALFGAELWAPAPLQADLRNVLVPGSGLALVFCGLGLLASFFHLGRPERAWRALAMWRTSWLSREVIALPLFMLSVAAYGLLHFLNQGMGLGRFHPASLVMGWLAVLLCLALFVCTAMVYACIRFLQEWASPLTLVNFLLLGCASGFTLATVLAVVQQSTLQSAFAIAALLLTFSGLLSRVASLLRNARLVPKSTLQSAIGIKHPRIVQKSQGFMGGSFNTREFFHGKSLAWVRCVKWFFLLFAFALPMLCLAFTLWTGSAFLAGLAFVLQYLGLLAERWYFFAQARHPQNLYYQATS